MHGCQGQRGQRGPQGFVGARSATGPQGTNSNIWRGASRTMGLYSVMNSSFGSYVAYCARHDQDEYNEQFDVLRNCVSHEDYMSLVIYQRTECANLLDYARTMKMVNFICERTKARCCSRSNLAKSLMGLTTTQEQHPETRQNLSLDEVIWDCDQQAVRQQMLVNNKVRFCTWKDPFVQQFLLTEARNHIRCILSLYVHLPVVQCLFDYMDDEFIGNFFFLVES